MREVEFRGKPIKDYGDAKWFYGSAVVNYEDELVYIEAPGYGCVPIEWGTVGQYIGLRISMVRKFMKVICSIGVILYDKLYIGKIKRHSWLKECKVKVIMIFTFICGIYKIY